MKLFIQVFVMLTFLAAAGCVKKSDSINANDNLSATQREAVKKSIIRYVSKAPDGVKGEARFKAEYDAYYQENLKSCQLKFFYLKDDYNYFLVTQPAASLIEKRHATGGRFKLDEKGELTEYEEFFRTWKMKAEDLAVRTEVIFRDMIDGKKLERYYTKHAGDKYIEFPDDRTYYDKEARAWKVK